DRFVVDDGVGRLYIDGGDNPVMERRVGSVTNPTSANLISFGDLTGTAGGEVSMKNFWYSTDPLETSTFHP
ncbi:MAG: hypothetical protein AAF492_08415, partial [Verrucomicrobiota bacterium]